MVLAACADRQPAWFDDPDVPPTWLEQGLPLSCFHNSMELRQSNISYSAHGPVISVEAARRA